MECIAIAGIYYLTAVNAIKLGIAIETGPDQILYRLDQTSISVVTEPEFHAITLKDYDSRDVVTLARYDPHSLSGAASPFWNFTVQELLASCPDQ